MPKNLPKGGRVKGGAPATSENRRSRISIGLTRELLDRLSTLPQITSEEWSKSYLIEQAVRLALGMPADYSRSDLELIGKNQIVE